LKVSSPDCGRGARGGGAKGTDHVLRKSARGGRIPPFVLGGAPASAVKGGAFCGG